MLSSILILVAMFGGQTQGDKIKAQRGGSVELDISYVDGGDQQKLDLYLPSQKSFTTAVFTFGGGWHSGSRKSVTAIGEKLQSLGFGCALLSHRLFPPDKFPSQIEDVAAAFAWVKKNIGQKGGDPNRVLLMGHSSGAHLSLLLATDAKYLAGHRLSLSDIAGVIGLSTPVDLEPRENKKGFGNALMAGKGADVFSRDDEVMKQASPIQHISKDLPPTLLIVGDRDFPMLEADAKAFAEKAKALGMSVITSVAKGRDHMGVVRSLLDDKDPVLDQVVAFLKNPKMDAKATSAYKNPALPTTRRVEDLIAHMTLEEKVAQMLCIWNAKKQITDSQGRFAPAKAPEWFKVGIGRIERPSDGHGARAEAEFTNAIQKWVKENTRLGIPVIFHEEGLHGLMGQQATSFPQAIALASTWNPELVEHVFATAAQEIRARGAHQVLAPVVDVARDPRWGRFEETYGEDPYLVARMGLAAVRGFQGGGRTIPAQHVIATLKHMTGHGQPESGTNVGPTSLGERTLREVFFYPFEVAIKQGHARSLMPSYNEIDGIPSHVNQWMLRDVLRKEWGFDGTIVSDWQAISQLVSRHHVAADAADAARQSLAATVDVELPDVETYHTLVDQVKQGKVSETAINDALRRLLRDKFELGLFENPFVDPARADEVSGAKTARPLALEAARQAIVLLQNRGNLLPLQADKIHRVAVVGPHAAEVMLGGYAGVPRHSVSILEGIRKRLGERATVRHSEGVRITEDSVFTREPQPLIGGTRSRARGSADRVVLADPAANRRRIVEAVELARDSDVAIIVVGDNEQTAREAYAENHLGDRSDLRLVGQQEELVRAVLDAGKPTVLVLINGRPMAIPELADKVPAILEGWYLGQEGGTAVAEVLFGDVNPSGKLPVSFPRSVGQLPIFYNRKPTARRGYLFDSTRPLFPFGHGLSYSTFAYSDPTISPTNIPPDGRATVSVEVTNTGARAGDEIVQLYVRAEMSRATRPVMELKGFRRVTLAPSERRTVTFELGQEQLAYYGRDMKRVVEPGHFQVMVGGSSDAVKSVALEVVEK